MRSSRAARAAGSACSVGRSRAEPSRTTPQPCTVPTMVSGAAFGCAQPLAQPETWSAMRSPERGTWRAISAARARAAIKPCAHDGAPGQAAMRRRGSEASAMKPRRSAATLVASASASPNGPNRSARPGAGRTQSAPVSSAMRARSMRPPASAWPKASPSPSAKTSPLRGCRPIGCARGARRDLEREDRRPAPG